MSQSAARDKEIAEAIDKDSFTEFATATIKGACVRHEEASYFMKAEEWSVLVALVITFDAVISDYRVWR